MHLVLQPNDHFMVVWLDQPKDQNQQLISSLTFIASQGSKNEKAKPNRQLKHQADVNVTGKQTEEVAADGGWTLKNQKGWNSPKAFYLQKRCDQVLAGDLRSCLGTAVPVKLTFSCYISQIQVNESCRGDVFCRAPQWKWLFGLCHFPPHTNT